MAIEWRNDLATGIDKIDKQHKELFSRINLLFEACGKGKAKEEVKETLNFLQDYVVVHFGTEEDFMSKYSYPDISEHKAKHKAFVADFLILKNQFETQGANLTLITRTNKVVVDWLIQHIGNVDKKLGAFLKMKGV